jgi:hypothetical protein
MGDLKIFELSAILETEGRISKDFFKGEVQLSPHCILMVGSYPRNRPEVMLAGSFLIIKVYVQHYECKEALIPALEHLESVLTALMLHFNFIVIADAVTDMVKEVPSCPEGIRPIAGNKLRECFRWEPRRSNLAMPPESRYGFTPYSEKDIAAVKGDISTLAFKIQSCKTHIDSLLNSYKMGIRLRQYFPNEAFLDFYKVIEFCINNIFTEEFTKSKVEKLIAKLGELEIRINLPKRVLEGIRQEIAKLSKTIEKSSSPRQVIQFVIDKTRFFDTVSSELWIRNKSLFTFDYGNLPTQRSKISAHPSSEYEEIHPTSIEACQLLARHLLLFLLKNST